MSTYVKITAAAAALACVTALGTVTATAAEPAPAYKCIDIVYKPELTKMYPRIAAGCQEVVVRDGKKYARFTAKVTGVGNGQVRVQFLNVVGHEGNEIAIKPNPKATVEIEGKKVSPSKLQKGDVLTFWVPESRIGVISAPEDEEMSEIVAEKK